MKAALGPLLFFCTYQQSGEEYKPGESVQCAGEGHVYSGKLARRNHAVE